MYYTHLQTNCLTICLFFMKTFIIFLRNYRKHIISDVNKQKKLCFRYFVSYNLNFPILPSVSILHPPKKHTNVVCVYRQHKKRLYIQVTFVCR